MELKNEMHLKFALDYLKHFNASEAARNAGYSQHTAGRQGYKLLKRPDIQEFMAEHRKKLTEQLDIELLDVITHLKQMAFFDLKDILTETGDIMPVSMWPSHASKLVAGYECEVVLKPDAPVIVKKVKIPSREKNTENLGRYVGAFTDNIKLDNPNEVKKIFVFPGWNPDTPLPDDIEELEGDNNNGNGRLPHSDNGGGNGKPTD